MAANTGHIDRSREVPQFEQIPKAITPRSSNIEVKLFLFDLLLKYDSERTKPQAWNLVKTLKGDGEGVFNAKEDYWIELFGEVEGPMLSRKMEKEKVDWEKNIPTDVSNVVLFYS